MAASGRMSTYHDRHPGGSNFTSPISGRTPPSQYQWPMVEEPGQEMSRINYVHTGKAVQRHSPVLQKHSPGLAQGRWSHASRDEEEEEEVPLSAIPHDDVGPGQGQAKDPFLHEQYFGVASSGVDGEVVPDPTHFAHPGGEHASWVRQ